MGNWLYFSKNWIITYNYVLKLDIHYNFSFLSRNYSFFFFSGIVSLRLSNLSIIIKLQLSRQHTFDSFLVTRLSLSNSTNHVIYSVFFFFSIQANQMKSRKEEFTCCLRLFFPILFLHNVISPFAETTELLKWKQDKNNFEMRILLLGSVKCKNRDLIRYIKVALSKVLSVHMKYILWAYHIREPAGLMYGRSSHMYNIKPILSSIITNQKANIVLEDYQGFWGSLSYLQI